MIHPALFVGRAAQIDKFRQLTAISLQVYEVTKDRAGAVTQVAKSNLSLKGHSGQVTALAFSADDTRAVTASKDGTWGVWDLTVRYKLNEDAKRLLRQVQVGSSVAADGAKLVCPGKLVHVATREGVGRVPPHGLQPWPACTCSATTRVSSSDCVQCACGKWQMSGHPFSTQLPTGLEQQATWWTPTHSLVRSATGG